MALSDPADEGSLPETADDARARAAALLQVPITEIERVPAFAGNRVFRVRVPAGERFLKFGSARDITTEHAVLRIVDGQGVPVPAVVAADLDGSVAGSPCLATRTVEGSPMSGDEERFADVAPQLARVHALPVDGFGAIVAGPDGRIRGEDRTWVDTLRRRVEAGYVVADAGLVPRHLVDDTATAFDAQSAIATVEDARLLHGDFHPRHVYAADGRITAIIDWGDATAGDPDYDIARVLHSVLLHGDLTRAIATAQTVLPDEQLPIEGHRLSKLLVYAAVFIVWAMEGEHEGGSPWPPWWPVQIRALERLLEAGRSLR